MNLLKAQDLLKGVPDQMLQQMLKNPSSSVPQFLVASEAARRAKVRQDYQSEMQGKPPSSTVVEDLVNNLGVASLQPPGQNQVPVRPPQMPAAPQQPVQMYDGGVVSLANGGDIEDYLRPEASGTDSGFSASVSPYIPGLDARIRAGILGSTNPNQPTISGYQLGYEDGKNAVLSTIIPTPMGNMVGAEYRRQLGDDSEIAVRGNISPFEQIPMEARQAPISVEYSKRFAKGGIAAFAEGGQPDMYKFMPGYAEDIKLEDVLPFETYLSTARSATGQSELPQYRSEIAAERAKLAQEEPDSLSSMLKYIGRGIAQSKGDTSFLGSIARGMSAGFEMQDQAKLKNKEAQRQLRQAEIELAQKERAEKAGDYALARQLEASAIDRRNTAMTQKYQANSLALTAQQARDNAIEAAERLKVEQARLGVEQARAAAEKAQRGQITPKDAVSLSTDILYRLSAARQNLDNLYKDAAADPNHWYSLEKERINAIPSATERRVALERLRQGLERDYGITGLKSRLQSIESMFVK